MSDASRELVDLRREIVEARNQAIKTDNQVKNLSLDVKGFEKRFDAVERRTRIAGLGVHAIVAVVIASAAYMVYGVRVKSVTHDLEQAIAEAKEAKQDADRAAEEAKRRLATVEKERSRHEKAAQVAQKLNDQLDKGREKEAVDLLGSIDLEGLTPLERRLVEKKLGDLRARTAEAAYRSAKSAISASRGDVAVTELRRSLMLDPDGRYASTARYLLATQLWSQKRHEEAEAAFRDILAKDSDKNVLDEVRYLLAGTLARLGRRDEAKAVYAEVMQRGGRYGSNARNELAALQSGGAPQPTSTAAKKATSPSDGSSATVARTPPAGPALPSPTTSR